MAEDRGTARTVALSDGVFAIALTLLVLTIEVPSADALAREGGLADALSDAWPFLIAYLAAFLTIGVTWLNHHTAFGSIGQIDSGLQWWNLMVLLAVSFMPVPTAFYASALSSGAFTPAARVAAVVFVLSSAVRQAIWVLFWRHVRRHPELLKTGADPDLIRADQRRAGIAAGLDAVGAAITFVVPLAAAALTAALALVFARGARRHIG